ncbi:TonB-dependent receptor [Pseudoteredinibacter isoporae]|uniref:TonB-dependent receptor n=1 Tax=Pseudoteredinibacter isoporae TaxID=570281 RepID=UPI00310B3B9E
MANATHQPFLPSRLAVAIATSIAASGFVSHSTAQSNEKLEEIIVFGNAASLNRALEKQRMADNIKSVISADSIGKLPDTNVSEALQRVPGVSIERDQGEGRFVSVRGLSADLNSVSINGMSTPSPESDRRAVALDVIPSDLVETLEVTKSITPDMDPDAIGGSVDVKSVSGFDRDGLFYSVSSEGSYDDLSGESSPKFAASASNIFSVGKGSDNLAIAGAISWFDREFGSNNSETGGKWEIEEGEAKLEEFEQRNYDITRERLGAAFNVDYKINDNHQIYLRNLFSEYTDTEQRLANIIEFEDPLAPGELGGLKEDDFIDGDGNELEDTPIAVRELKQRLETQKIYSSVFGGEYQLNDWTLEYNVGYSKSEEVEPEHIAEAKFVAHIEGDVGFTQGSQPQPMVPESFYDPNRYFLESVELARSHAQDEASSFKFDVSKSTEIAGNPTLLKFGAKMTQREKTADETVNKVEETLHPLSDFANSDVNYKLHRFGPGINSSAVLAAIQGEERELDIEESNAGDWTIEEDLRAVYAMATMDIDQLRVVFGARYQEVDFDANGFAYDDDADDGQQISPRRARRKDSHFLPAFHLRYSVSENTQLRAAWTNSVVRPTFEQARPGYILEDDGEKGSFGNPMLQPWETSNLDLGVEHYMGFAGVVSAFAFYKDIDTFIYDTVTDQLAGFDAIEEAEIALNGQDAKLYGVEFAWSKQLNELPEPFNGLLLSANLTLAESDAQIDTIEGSRSIRLPQQSDTTGNFTIGYDNDKLSLRLAANYKSNYLDEINAESPVNDIIVDDHFQLDFSARYFIQDNIQIFFEAININDEPFYAYVSNPRWNAQFEDYGPTFKLGATITNF